MAISASEHIELRCLSCGEHFATEVWSLVDAVERPDLAEALLEGTLNAAVCPHCDTVNQSQVALLYHDGERRRVYFAVPAGAEEHRWRETAQALLYQLANELPEEAQLPYLGDVQVEQEIAGVRRSVLRRQRGRNRSATPSFGKPIELPNAVETVHTALIEQSAPDHAPPSLHAPDVLVAVEQALSVNTLDDLRVLVLRHPELLTDTADALLRQLAETAFNEGDRDLSTAIHAARTTLRDLHAGREVVANEPLAEEQLVPMLQLPDAAYRAVLHTADDTALMDAIRLFPALLEPWADDDLARREETALDEGNERLATLIDERREALSVLRLALTDEAALEQAIEALLAAQTTDALELALLAHPTLLTDGTLQLLDTFAAAAHARGDEANAKTALARAATLRQVRAGVESA